MDPGDQVSATFDGAALAAEHSPDGLVVIDGEGLVRWSSDASTRLMGFGHDEVVGRHLLEFVHRDDLNKAIGAFVEAGRRPGFHLPVHFRLINNDRVWVDCDVSGRTFERDGASWMVVSIRPISERNVVDDRRSRLERLLQRASVDCSRARWLEIGDLIERYLESLADVVGAIRIELAWEDEGSGAAVEAVWPRSRDSVDTFTSLWNEAEPDGYDVRFCSELETLPPSALRDQLISSGARAVVEMPLSGGRTLATIRLVLGEDWLRWDDPNADVVALLASTLMSTTRRGRAEEQLHERARRDPMTGLLNRDELYRALSDLLDRNETDGLGVLYGDLDHFKDVNDRFGHAEGDRLVMGVAAALVANVRDGDLVARFGGDEFVVVCPDLDSPHQLDTIAERVSDAVRRLAPPGIRLRISFGSAMARRGIDADELIRLADESMYTSKRSRGHSAAC